MQEYIVSHALSLQFSFYRISKQQQASPVMKHRKRKSQKRKLKKDKVKKKYIAKEKIQQISEPQLHIIQISDL
jgi:hypothetical protein